MLSAIKISELLGSLKQRRALDAPAKIQANVGELPPFYALNAALEARVRTWRGVFFVTTAILVLVITTQQRLLSHKMFEKMNEQIVIVPGSPEFFRVRPGQIPDESVFLFAEYIASNLGTFSYRNLKYHFGKVSEHMAPAAKGRFEASIEQREKDWTARKVDQTFAYEPVKRFDLVTDEHGPKYTAAIEGIRVQYVEGHSFNETRDVLVLEFRTRGNLTPDRPFIFEIENLEWMTPEQYQALKVAKNLGSSAAKEGVSP